MIQVNAIGDACPLPVVKAQNAIKALTGPDVVEVLVDNETAVQNLARMANGKGYAMRSEKQAEGRFRVVLEIGEAPPAQPVEDAPAVCPAAPGSRKKNIVVAVASACMGAGDDALGAILMKGFLFALTQQEVLPGAVLFYNGGARLTTEGSASLEDLKSLAAQGVEILTCGTCLNHYGLSDKLRVGDVTNMYAIVEKLAGADLVVRP